VYALPFSLSRLSSREVFIWRCQLMWIGDQPLSALARLSSCFVLSKELEDLEKGS